jgi:hypothetical protein
VKTKILFTVGPEPRGLKSSWCIFNDCCTLLRSVTLATWAATNHQVKIEIVWLADSRCSCPNGSFIVRTWAGWALPRLFCIYIYFFKIKNNAYLMLKFLTTFYVIFKVYFATLLVCKYMYSRGGQTYRKTFQKLWSRRRTCDG